MAYFPLFLRHDANVLVVGGGVIATAKVEALSSCGVRVTIVAKEVRPELLALADKQGHRVRVRPYQSSDVEGQKVVVVATSDATLNEAIAAEARAAGALVNVVDNPRLCDFIFPALIKRGAIQVAISSEGVSPVLARLIKQQIEQVLPARLERLIDYIKAKTPVVRDYLHAVQPRRLLWEQVVRGAIAEEVYEGNLAKADALFAETLSQTNPKPQAALYLVGAGAGHPELMTVKGIRLLSRADVVLYDRLANPQLIEQYARKDAVKIPVGKARGEHSKTQGEIDALIESALLEGQIVVRLKGGDPGVYAHGAEEIGIARRLGVPYQIVPGISAAQACAAYAGFPLTERDGARSVHLLSLYEDALEDASVWESLRSAKRDTLVFYMSSPHYTTIIAKLLQLGFKADTPLMVIEHGSMDGQRTTASTLADFAVQHGGQRFASPNLLVIGDVVRWHAAHQWKEPSHVAA